MAPFLPLDLVASRVRRTGGGCSGRNALGSGNKSRVGCRSFLSSSARLARLALDGHVWAGLGWAAPTFVLLGL
jgi:hypothetical protein